MCVCVCVRARARVCVCVRAFVLGRTEGRRLRSGQLWYTVTELNKTSPPVYGASNNSN